MVLFELACKTAYVIGLGLNVAGLVQGDHLLRQVALPCCAGSLALLILSWHRRLGWVNPSYACCFLLGLGCMLLGDVFLAQPIVDYLDYAGFLFHMVALLLFAVGMSIPSAPPDEALPVRTRGTYSRLLEAVYGKHSVAKATAAQAEATPPLGAHALRGAVPVAVAVALMIVWRVLGGSDEAEDDPRFTAAGCLAALQAVLLWRALARVGYASPVVTVTGLLQAARRYRAAASGARGAEGGGDGGGRAEAAEARGGGGWLGGLFGGWLGRGGGERRPLRQSLSAGGGAEGGGGEDADDDFGGAGAIGSAVASAADGGALASQFMGSRGRGAAQATPPVSGNATSPRGTFGASSSSSSSFAAAAAGNYRPPSQQHEPQPAPTAAAASRGAAALRRGLQRLRQQRSESNARLLASELHAVEARVWQWTGVAGAAVLSAGLLALGYDRLWLYDDPSADGYTSFAATWLTYAYTAATWVGQTLLALSVPCALPRTCGLTDPAVAPGPTEGQALRVAILLPHAAAFDVAEVAVPWYTLTRRGHAVVFVTRDGFPGAKLRRVLPLPAPSSVYGFGCIAAATEGLVAAGGGGGGAAADGDAGGGGGGGSAGWLPCCMRLICWCCLRGPRRQRRCGGLCCCCCCCCPGAGAGEDRLDASAGASSSSSSLPFQEMDAGVGAASPLVVAMYREMLADAAFRHPQAWCPAALTAAAAAALARKAAVRARVAKRRAAVNSARRAQRSGGLARGAEEDDNSDGAGGGGAGGDGGLLTAEAVAAAAAEHLFVPEAADGLLVVGAYPAAAHSALFDDPDLAAAVLRFWATERPLACVGNAPLLLARATDAAGRSLLADRMVTALPAAIERCNAWLYALLGCAWPALLGCGAAAGRSGGRRRFATVQAEVQAALAVRAHFVPAPRACSLERLAAVVIRGELAPVRVADPLAPPEAAVVVEDGPLLTAQCGGEAFVLARRFVARLEELQRAF